MASKVIKGGTVVSADLSYEADVKIEGGRIVEIGAGLSGADVLLHAVLEAAEIAE